MEVLKLGVMKTKCFICQVKISLAQVCEYCSKEFTGSIGKVKFALKEHIQVGWEIENGAQMLNSCFRQYTWVFGKPATSVERHSSLILY